MPAVAAWVRHTLLLCNYGLLKELRPGVPFLTPYLIADKNFTDAELYGHVYPFWTYSYLFLLVPAFALTDLLRYKPVILVEVACLIGTWSALLWGSHVWHMQLMQVLFGAASAAEVAYFSYIYAAVSPTHYATVTSYVRAATLAGKLCAYGVGQLVVTSGVMHGSYTPLNYASLAALALAAPCATLLPSVRRSSTANAAECDASVVADHQNRQPTHSPTTVDYSWRAEVMHYFKDTLRKLRANYSDTTVLKWSLWWALATCGYLQVGNYIQNLWATMQTGQTDVLNGVVEAVNHILGVLVAFCMQFVHVNWRLLGEPVLAACTLLMAGLLLICALSYNLYATYGAYIAVCVAYQMLITIATCNVARHALPNTYGLVIGGNTLTALLLQTALTFAVTDAHGLALHIVDQFVVYAGFFVCIGAVYALMAVRTIFATGGCRQYVRLAMAVESCDEGSGEGEGAAGQGSGDDGDEEAVRLEDPTERL